FANERSPRVRNAFQRRAMGAILAAVIALAATGCVATQTTTSTSPNSQTGFSFTGDLLSWSDAQIIHDFQDVKAMGGTWVRVPFNWSTLEPNRAGDYEWFVADRVVYIANWLHLKVYAVVSYAPRWARPAGSRD